MKKCSFILLLLMVLTAQAQEITTQSLQGTWQMVTYEGSGVLIDVTNNTYEFLEEFKEINDASETERIEKEISSLLEKGFSGDIIFTGDAVRVSFTRGGDTSVIEGTYKIVKDKELYIDIMENDEKSADRFRVHFEADKLVLSRKGNIVITYIKKRGQ